MDTENQDARKERRAKRRRKESRRRRAKKSPRKSRELRKREQEKLKKQRRKEISERQARREARQKKQETRQEKREARQEKRDARQEKREARQEKRDARQEKREARQEKRDADDILSQEAAFVNNFIKTGLTQTEIQEIRQSRREEFTSGLSEDDTREYLAATGTVLPQGADILSQEAAFVNNFIKTGLTQTEIQEIRQSRREEFTSGLSEDDTREYLAATGTVLPQGTDILSREAAFVNNFIKTGLTQTEIQEIRQSRREEFTSGLSEDDTREYLAATGTVLPQGTDILSREAAFVNNFIKTGLTQTEIQEIRQSRREEFTSGLSEDDTREYLAATGTVLPQGTDLRSREVAYVNNFIKTGLTQAEIQEIRKSRREEFEASLSEDERAEFAELLRERRQEAKLVQNAGTLPQELTARNKLKVTKARDAGIIKERPASFRGLDSKRARTLRTIVKPEFQQTRHVDTMVREMREKNPTRVTEVMLAQASSMGPVTGRTFFPPQNANPTIVHPWTARFTPPTKPLPTYMNWADTANVAAVRGWKLPKSRLSRAKRVSTDTKGYLHEVVDQLGCGSCWSVSVAGAMSDRVSIWSQEENPQLSITNILGCVSDDEGSVVEGASMYSPATAGCSGGIPTGAVEMLAQFGDAAANCVGYEWCENDPVCNQNRRLGFSDAPEYLNSIIPACADMLDTCIRCNGECEASSRPRTAWGLETYPSGRPYILLTDPLSIQQEIAAHGPVVATYAIYGDFQNGTAAILGDGWAKTNGVYCNVQEGRKPYSGTRYAGSERQMIGYHAVVIVGWGLERNVPDWQNPGATFDIPYWIVRNSWGTQWNEGCMVNGINMPGHCKFAMIDRVRGINTKTYLDTADDGLIGAAVSFRPMVIRVEPPVEKEPQVDTEPVMHEERLDTSAEVDEDVKLAGLARDGAADVPDMSEFRRNHINEPILCLDNTPDTIRAVNCRLGTAQTDTTFRQWLPIVVLGILTVTVVVLLWLKLRRS